MEKFLLGMLDEDLHSIMQQGRERLLKVDSVYLKDLDDLHKLEERYESLDLTQQQRMLINDYIACIETVQAREVEIAFINGLSYVLQLYKKQK